MDGKLDCFPEHESFYILPNYWGKISQIEEISCTSTQALRSSWSLSRTPASQGGSDASQGGSRVLGRDQQD